MITACPMQAGYRSSNACLLIVVERADNPNLSFDFQVPVSEGTYWLLFPLSFSSLWQ